MNPVMNVSGVEFILIPSGRFVSIQRGKPVEVTITAPFYLSKFPVTQKLWREYMPFTPWRKSAKEGGISAIAAKQLTESDNCPAVCITLPEALAFCERFSSVTGVRCQLPTMAQWEHACRAGANTKYFWGDGEYDKEIAAKYAWFDVGSLPQVGQRLPNPWGLQDIAGLVQEWVLDRHNMASDCQIPKTAFVDAVVDPLAVGGTHGICMGGGFRNSILSLACSSHVVHTTDVRQVDIGLRLAISALGQRTTHVQDDKSEFSDTATAMAMTQFHGFYYTNKEGGVHGLKLTKQQSRTMEAIWNGSFDVLPQEVYWRRLARYMMTHAPQGYIAWNGVPHWIVGNCGRIIGSGGYEKGINVLQFHEDRTFAYQWYSLPKATDEDEYDPIYDLVFTPWDWLLEGEGDDQMFKLGNPLVGELSRLMAWTDEVHAELEKRWPSEKNWE